VRSGWLLIPLALATWALVHESGVHATVAGVLLGFAVPVMRRDGEPGPGLAEHFEHAMRPISAGFAVPVFAFFAAGVTFGGYDGLVTALSDPIALGIVFGLVVGKAVGIFGTTRMLAAFTRASLDAALRWIDVLGVSMLAGIGFTVSLLIGELAYGSGSAREDVVKVGVLAGSLLAALLAGILLRIRNRHYRAVCQAESADSDRDGVPDVYQSTEPTAGGAA
jgi:NhaA family Na+:H+ antiporter